ncbi:MAG: hypothetical protein LBQ22_02055 [Bacteroidales bacterium]|jgi:hypothetical protein|nr:hypothetical protein [Bacteroidales bacterium]
MSLDTVLQIGKAFRNSENNLKYFKYVESCPKDKDGNWPICITIPVKSDFTFEWENVKLTPENQREQLYYLKFKTSDSDGLVKYIFGDIYYERKGSLKKDSSIETGESGYYRLENPFHSNAAYRPSSFKRGNSDYENLMEMLDSDSIITKFHDLLKTDLLFIERILKYASAINYFFENKGNENFIDFLNNEEILYSLATSISYQALSNANLKKIGIESDVSALTLHQKKQLFELSNFSVFIHFDFPENKQWYQFSEDLSQINKKILSEFVDEGKNGLVLKKTLYKTLCSGDKKNDIQFPGFLIENKFKSKNFDENELQDLFYALDFTNKGRLISGTDIKLIVLPRGINLKASDYEIFIEKKDENRIAEANKESIKEDIFFDFSSDENKNITSFDLILCKKGGLTSPDSDLIEISGIEKSKLRLIMKRINDIAYEIEEERKSFIRTEKELFPLKFDYSFRCILGNPQYDVKTNKVSFKPNPKYQSHLLKILPLIYTENYFYDDVLLPAFIQNVEFSIRSGDAKYSFLKYDLKFLLSIQNYELKNKKIMEISNSESYQIGYMLGELAKSLKSEINSFEKNYVGNLTRRIGNLADFMKLKTDIEQKLIMHDKAKYTRQISYDLAQKIKNFEGKYDKDESAFGFMEAYFKPIPKKEEIQKEYAN